MKNKQKISVVIPSYNGLKLLQNNLPAVLNCLRNHDELIIVDDASSDKSFEWLRREFGLRVSSLGNTSILKDKIDGFIGRYQKGNKKIKVAVFINKKNYRFGESVNRGVKLATNPLIFLLNNDVSPKKNVLNYLLSYFSDKKVFGVGLMENEVIKSDEGKKQTVKSGKNKLWFEKGLFFTSRAKNFGSGETAWVSGGSGIFSRKKWLTLDGFDQRYYPAYWEDIDLSFRARKKGWKILFEPKAVVDHNHETTNKTAFGQRKMDEMSWKNADKFTWKNGNVWQKVSFVLWRGYWWWKRKQIRK